jgi:hypothetical protein
LTVRRDAQRFALIAGRHLRSDERLLARIGGAPATVITDRDEVVITGKDVSAFRVWAPAAFSVRVNGAAADWTRCGGYVVSASSC